MITQERVRELFEYRDGELFWRVKKSTKIKIGDKAGYNSGGEYILTEVDGRAYGNHRLIFLYHHGYLPENHVDHINRITNDNRIENLREVSRSCNMKNTGNWANNTSGVKGVSLHLQGKWLASISIKKKSRHIGVTEDFLEAVCMRLAAEQCLEWDDCNSSSPAYQYVNANLRGRINKADRSNLTMGV